MAVQNEVLVQLFDPVTAALNELVKQGVLLIPAIVAAIIIVVIGWVVGIIAKKIIAKALEAATIDRWLEEQNLSSALGGQKLSLLIGSFVKWYIIAIFLAQAVDQFKLLILREFLATIAYYIPLLLIALLIFVAGLLIGRYIRNAIESTKYRFKKTAALTIEIAVVYISVVIALQSIGIDTTILITSFNIAFAAFALTVAIVIGIAFGFALKDDAKKVLDELRKA